MTDPLKCPSCESPEPRLHPATQAKGEVTHVCPDAFHSPGNAERYPQFKPGWLQDQVERSVAAIEALPEGLRRNVRDGRG